MLKFFVNLLYLFNLSVQVTFLCGNMQTMVPIFYIPMHDVVPNVVAMAVRMVMAMCRIFCQMVWLFMVFLCLELLVMSYGFLWVVLFFTTD